MSENGGVSSVRRFAFRRTQANACGKVEKRRIRRFHMSQLVVTAVGQDRPGLVGEFTGHLHSAGANIVESRMVNLRGQFAVILLLESANTAQLKEKLPGIGQKTGLAFSVIEPAAATTTAKGIPYKLKTYSLDQPGLVHRVSEVLRAHGVNIEDLTARQESAPFAGDPLFLMEMKLTVPGAVQVKALRNDLNLVCEKLNCDLDLEPA
jgi:glycine cleavage system transcriptional repressor